MASGGAGLGKDFPLRGKGDGAWAWGIGFLFGGGACGSQLSRRRLVASRDMGWKMASPTEGKSRLRDPSPAPLATSAHRLPVERGLLSFPLPLLFLGMRVRLQLRRFFTGAPEELSFPRRVPDGWRGAPARETHPGPRRSLSLSFTEGGGGDTAGGKEVPYCSFLLGRPMQGLALLIFGRLELFPPTVAGIGG